MPLYHPGQSRGGLNRLSRGLFSLPAGVAHPEVPNENGIYFPVVDADWQAIGVSPWGSVWGMQEGTGSLVGSGSAAFTLAPAGSPVYRRPVSGWSRVGIAATSGTAQGLRAASGTGPDITQTAVAWLGYFLIKTPSANKHVLGGMNPPLSSQYTYLQVNNGTIAIFAGGAQANGAAAYNHDDGAVHPVLIVAQSQVGASLFTDMDKAVRTFATALQEGPKGIGPLTSTGNSPNETCIYLACCSGSVAAALRASGSAAAFLTSLGWNPAFTV